MHLLKLMKKLSGFIKKLKLWKIKLNEGAGKHYYLMLQQFLTSIELDTLKI